MEEIIKRALEIRDAYLESTQGLEKLPIHDGKLKNIIQERTGWTITDRIVPGLTHIRGMLARRPANKEALVLIADSDVNNECWRRFTFIKEISHLFLEDTEESYCNDALKLASTLVETEIETDRSLFMKEAIGVVAAIELLIPTGHKDHIQHLVTKGFSNYQIASKYKVPERYIEYRLNKWGITPIK